MIENYNDFSVALKTLMDKYDSAELHRDTWWALLNQKDEEQICSSLMTHKRALNLAVETTMLHVRDTDMEMVVATDAKNASNDTLLIRECTMKIAESLSRQEEILEQLTWLRAIALKNSAGGSDRTLQKDDYLESMAAYASSLCENSVSDDGAEEMARLSLQTHPSSADTSNFVVNLSRPPATLSYTIPQSMTILIGNTHRQVAPQPEHNPSNKHLWSFYLQASGEEIIHEVIIYLHSAFTPTELRLRNSPYRITRTGWGYFIIDITIVLKPGYLWQKEKNRSLKLEWELDFENFGSSVSYDCAVAIENGNVLC